MGERNAESVAEGKATIFASHLRRSEMRFEGPTAEGRYLVAFYNEKGRLWGPMLFLPDHYEVVPDDAPTDDRVRPMAERSVHEAAVEALAADYHARWKDGGCAHVGKWHQCRVDARCAIAALVASAEVRKGLVRTVLASNDVWFLGADDPRNDTGSNGFRPWPLVDVVRAALAGPEAAG